MKSTSIHQHRIARQLVRCAGAIALSAAALAPVLARGGGEETERERNAQLPGPGPGPGAAIGDETIGTLPMFQSGSLLELVRGFPITRPSLFIEGNLDEVLNLIAFAHGMPRVEVVPLDDDWQHVRLVFIDEVLLAIDRLAVQGADVQFGMWLPEEVPYAPVHFTFGGRTCFLEQPQEPNLALPLPYLCQSGALLGSPLALEVPGSFGPSGLMAVADADFLYLVQRH